MSPVGKRLLIYEGEHRIPRGFEVDIWKGEASSDWGSLRKPVSHRRFAFGSGQLREENLANLFIAGHCRLLSQAPISRDLGQKGASYGVRTRIGRVASITP